MFKRTNKITSLLVASAAMASLMPTAAFAADFKKVESQDGTVYNAVAYKDGQFYIDAKINDKDETAYYLADGKYNELSDLAAGEDTATYGTKYANLNDGDNFVDLTNGKVTDETVDENTRIDAETSLKKKVKADTDGRYLKDGSTYAADNEQKIEATNEIPGAKFGETWYNVKLANKEAANGYAAQSSNGTDTLNVFTDGNGNYIDADYNLGKVRVTTTATASSVAKSAYIENTNDTYDTADSRDKVFATVAQDKIVGQDKDFIYRIVTVTIKTSDTHTTISEIDGKKVSDATAFTAVTNGYEFKAIQKISKAQNSDEIGGAKYAKSAMLYVISDEDGKTNADDFTSYDNYAITNEKVTGYKTAGDKVYIQTAELKTSGGLYYTDLQDSSDEDITDNSNCVEVDADGNVWRLDGGSLYKWDNDSHWDKVYKVDGSYNKMSVYDANNIVAWNDEEETYAVIGGKADTKTTDTTTAAAVTTTTVTGWAKATDGTWHYVKADGTNATGWLQDGATWYYLNSTGVMQTGWLNDNGTWYYLNGSGAMLFNTTVDGYTLGANGAWTN
ncbi:N-acetylmuramoyl-L-alanine amidase family protein [Clostridium saccharoperbutylacetonicum]|uniref:N-acetylmuramoyl-L-alanine amidase family protein n=1 Tax=Clostridium saccharoperbutylacetonicum TaxID=36745 RepID=UPI0039EC5FCE